jgi:Zn-dependent M28 family amino/carboxypeptidase
VEYVLGQMRRSTRLVAADTFRVKRRSGGEGVLINATATLPGVTDSLLVICAHIDASASRDAGWSRNWSRMSAPGADDDGTGIAAMLEVLTLAAHAQSKPRYTIMFVASNAEERNPDYAGLAHRDGHHLGSRHLAANLKAMGRPIKGVIAMDMVGWNPRENFMYLFAGPRATPLARELAERNLYLRLNLTLPTTFTPCPNSDNESFDRYGIPAVLFMEGCAPWRSDARHPRNPAYHSARDLPGAVTYPILDMMTRLVYSFVMTGDVES